MPGLEIVHDLFRKVLFEKDVKFHKLFSDAFQMMIANEKKNTNFDFLKFYSSLVEFIKELKIFATSFKKDKLGDITKEIENKTNKKNTTHFENNNNNNNNSNYNHNDCIILGEDSPIKNNSLSPSIQAVSDEEIKSVPNLSEDEKKYVQIKVDKAEIERRIKAFTSMQREKINLLNVQEFCGIDYDAECSCARVDAIFSKQPTSKSHLQIKRVVNDHGPQTRFGKLGRGNWDTLASSGVDERLRNIEKHMSINYDPLEPKRVPRDVYKRIQMLEERILFLESLSPEYFNSNFDSFPGD